MRVRSTIALLLCLAPVIFASAGCSQGQQKADVTKLPGYDPTVKAAPPSQAYPPAFDLKREQQGIPPGKGPDFSKIVSH